MYRLAPEQGRTPVTVLSPQKIAGSVHVHAGFAARPYWVIVPNNPLKFFDLIENFLVLPVWIEHTTSPLPRVGAYDYGELVYQV